MTRIVFRAGGHARSVRRRASRGILVGNGLGLLVLVVAAGLLEAVDEGDVLLLGLVRGGAVIDNSLPRVLLGLALFV